MAIFRNMTNRRPTPCALDTTAIHSVIFVPGWFSGDYDYRAERAILREIYPRAMVTRFSWNSEQTWTDAVRDSEDREPAALVERLRSCSVSPAQTVLIGHSLGARILLRTLARFDVTAHHAVLLGAAIDVDVSGFRVRVPRDRAVSHEGSVLVGVRPEKVHLVLGDDAAPDDANVIGPGRVTDVAFTGVSTQYRVEIPGVGTVSVFAQNVFGGSRITPGTEVHVACAVEHTFGLDGGQDAGAGAVLEED